MGLILFVVFLTEKYRLSNNMFYIYLLQEEGGVTSCMDMFRKQWREIRGQGGTQSKQ